MAEDRMIHLLGRDPAALHRRARGMRAQLGRGEVPECPAEVPEGRPRPAEDDDLLITDAWHDVP